MQRVLITGCSTGIGRATAELLTQRGYHVIATARDPNSLCELDVAERFPLDVTDVASVAALCAAVGPIDVLVNNAGINAYGPVERIPLVEAERLFETNFFGALRMLQAFVPAMRERGRGTVVNISSLAGRIGPPLVGVYAASKFALEGLSEALRFELAHFGVRVILIEPGYTESAMRGRSPHFGDDEPPYAELRRLWEGSDAVLVGGQRPTATRVAEVIAEALAADAPPLRWPVGADAELVLKARAAMDDERFEATMRSFLKIDW